MACIMLPDLQVILFFVCFIIESFEKVFMCYFTMSYDIIYRITIILNTLDKMANYIEFMIVKG